MSLWSKRVSPRLAAFLRLSFSTFRWRQVSSRNLKPYLPFVFGALTPIAATSASRAFILLAAVENKKKNMEEEIKKAEELYSEHKFIELYEYLLQYKDCDNAEILWRLVRAARDRSAMDGVSADEKKKITFDAFEVSKKALELGENNYACHKWYGIMLSQTGDYLGTKKKIEDSKAMKFHFEKAIELNPEDSTSRYLMGMWCFSFANLGWFERKAAALVFGTPPESTFDDALVHFLKSEELSPSGYSKNQLMIAEVYLKLGKKPEAKQWFEKLKNFDVVTDEDKNTVKKAEEHLKSL